MLTLSKTEVLELLALFPALFFYNEQKDQVIHNRISFAVKKGLKWEVKVKRGKMGSIFTLMIVFTWRHASTLGTKQWNGRHVGVPENFCGDWILFSCKNFLLFQEICLAANHVSENDLWNKEYYTLSVFRSNVNVPCGFIYEPVFNNTSPFPIKQSCYQKGKNKRQCHHWNDDGQQILTC